MWCWETRFTAECRIWYPILLGSLAATVYCRKESSDADVAKAICVTKGEVILQTVEELLLCKSHFNFLETNEEILLERTGMNAKHPVEGHIQ